MKPRRSQRRHSDHGGSNKDEDEDKDHGRSHGSVRETIEKIVVDLD